MWVINIESYWISPSKGFVLDVSFLKRARSWNAPSDRATKDSPRLTEAELAEVGQSWKSRSNCWTACLWWAFFACPILTPCGKDYPNKNLLCLERLENTNSISNPFCDFPVGCPVGHLLTHCSVLEHTYKISRTIFELQERMDNFQESCWYQPVTRVTWAYRKPFPSHRKVFKKRVIFYCMSTISEFIWVQLRSYRHKEEKNPLPPHSDMRTTPEVLLDVFGMFIRTTNTANIWKREPWQHIFLVDWKPLTKHPNKRFAFHSPFKKRNTSIPARQRMDWHACEGLRMFSKIGTS